MRTVSSAFWLRLQGDAVNLSEMIELTAKSGSYKWTTCNVPLVSSGSVYSPFPGHGATGTEESTDLGVAVLDFVVANTGNLKGLIDGQDFDMAALVIRRVFVDTPDLGSMEIFRGKIGDYTYTRNTITGQARNAWNGVSAQFPFLTYQDNCTWRFGSLGCGFSTSSITVAGSLNVGSSTRLTLSATAGTLTGSYAPGQLERGRVTILSGANSGQARTVRSNSGEVVGLSHTLPFSLELTGVTFSIFPGCRKRLFTDCVSKYNNADGFLGEPWMPRLEQAF